MDGVDHDTYWPELAAAPHWLNGVALRNDKEVALAHFVLRPEYAAAPPCLNGVALPKSNITYSRYRSEYSLSVEYTVPQYLNGVALLKSNPWALKDCTERIVVFDQRVHAKNVRNGDLVMFYATESLRKDREAVRAAYESGAYR